MFFLIGSSIICPHQANSRTLIPFPIAHHESGAGSDISRQIRRKPVPVREDEMKWQVWKGHICSRMGFNARYQEPCPTRFWLVLQREHFEFVFLLWFTACSRFVFFHFPSTPVLPINEASATCHRTVKGGTFHSLIPPQPDITITPLKQAGEVQYLMTKLGNLTHSLPSAMVEGVVPDLSGDAASSRISVSALMRRSGHSHVCPRS